MKHMTLLEIADYCAEYRRGRMTEGAIRMKLIIFCATCTIIGLNQLVEALGQSQPGGDGE